MMHIAFMTLSFETVAVNRGLPAGDVGIELRDRLGFGTRIVVSREAALELLSGLKSLFPEEPKHEGVVDK